MSFVTILSQIPESLSQIPSSLLSTLPQIMSTSRCYVCQAAWPAALCQGHRFSLRGLTRYSPFPACVPHVWPAPFISPLLTLPSSDPTAALRSAAPAAAPMGRPPLAGVCARACSAGRRVTPPLPRAAQTSSPDPRRRSSRARSLPWPPATPSTEALAVATTTACRRRLRRR